MYCTLGPLTVSIYHHITIIIASVCPFIYLQTAFGMGESESFYSWLIAVFNFGSVFGAIVSGFLVHCVPYWHLFAISLVTHITGFTLYAVTYKGWLILISKFLSGYFIGAQWSLSIGYTAKSAEEYVGILRGVELDRGSVEKVKRYVFSSQAVGVAIGFVVGPGELYCNQYYYVTRVGHRYKSMYM